MLPYSLQFVAPMVDELLNLTYIAIKTPKARTGERWEDPSRPHRQDGNIAVGGIGDLAR